jgi:hypothetical protein
MLRKMYLVPTDRYHGERQKRRNVRLKRNPHYEWVKMRHRLREADIRDKSGIKEVSEFLKRVLPDSATTTTTSTAAIDSSTRSRV